MTLLLYFRKIKLWHSDVMWLHPGSCPPDLVRRNRGLVNSFTRVIAFALIRICCLGGYSGATQVFGYWKIKMWQWCDVITPWQQYTWSCSLESWPCEFVSLVLLHSPWSGSVAWVDVFKFWCYGDTKTESDADCWYPRLPLWATGVFQEKR